MKKLALLIILLILTFILIEAVDFTQPHVYDLGCLGADCPAENELGTPYPTMEAPIFEELTIRSRP